MPQTIFAIMQMTSSQLEKQLQTRPNDATLPFTSSRAPCSKPAKMRGCESNTKQSWDVNLDPNERLFSDTALQQSRKNASSVFVFVSCLYFCLYLYFYVCATNNGLDLRRFKNALIKKYQNWNKAQTTTIQFRHLSSVLLLFQIIISKIQNSYLSKKVDWWSLQMHERVSGPLDVGLVWRFGVQVPSTNDGYFYSNRFQTIA